MQDREIGGFIRAVLGQALVNTFPSLGSRFLIVQELDYNNGKSVVSV
jgi:hypothetical protein